MSRWYGAIARNKQGRLGIVLGWAYDHSNDGKQFKFHGIGIRGGKWRSHEQSAHIFHACQVEPARCPTCGRPVLTVQDEFGMADYCQSCNEFGYEVFIEPIPQERHRTNVPSTTIPN